MKYCVSGIRLVYLFPNRRQEESRLSHLFPKVCTTERSPFVFLTVGVHELATPEMKDILGFYRAMYGEPRVLQLAEPVEIRVVREESRRPWRGQAT